MLIHYSHSMLLSRLLHSDVIRWTTILLFVERLLMAFGDFLKKNLSFFGPNTFHIII